MAITIYGIKNCETMKKARAWLDDHGVAYAFHDYKAAGIERDWPRLRVVGLRREGERLRRRGVLLAESHRQQDGAQARVFSDGR